MEISALNRKIEPCIMGVNVWVCNGVVWGYGWGILVD